MFGRSAGSARFELVLEVLGVSKSPYPQGLQDFIRDENLTTQYRAAITYLSTRGRYPNTKQVEKLVHLIDRENYSEAIESINKASNYWDGKRLLVPADKTLVDVTRYSRTAEMSGIPRVVKNFVTSSAAKGADFAVWSDHVFGPVQITKDGIVYFHRKVWGNSRSLHQFYFLIRKIFFSRSPKMARMKMLALALKALRRLLFGRILLRMVDMTAPKACYIINPRTFVIPEVPDAANSELLRVWIESTKQKNVRCIVHDLLPLTHPEYFPKHAFGEHQKYVNLLKVCSTLIVGTPILAREVAEHLGTPDPMATIKVLPLPVNLKPGATKHSDSSKPLLTFVGGYQARKGLKGLVDFLDTFDNSAIDFTIAVVGAPNLLSGHDEGRLYSRLLKRPEVYEVHDSLEDEQFASLIKSSSAVLYVSTAEGYGLPVLEALSLGVPVIATDTPVNQHFSDLYGGIQLLSNTYAAHDLATLSEIARRQPRWNSLVSSIKSENLPVSVDKWVAGVLSI